MSRIHILPPELADKIAAGEVVERPASVVKELIENALDAKASSIRIDIQKGGREKIQVSDDGCGMTFEEAGLAVQRHATSKIQSLEDLSSIQTLGFRGEALPSIASVSHFILETKPKENNLEGTYVEVQGGQLIQARAAGCKAGTAVTVKDLFYNVPARRKFLKSDGVEAGHIEEVVIHLALGRLDCRFDLYRDGVLRFSLPVSSEPLARLKNCLGNLFVEDCFSMEEKTPEFRLRGFLVHPRQSAKNPQSIYFYLNGRYLKDKVLNHALMEGFSDFLMKGQYPKAVLYLEMSPAGFDVNVHPSKREVRFVKPQEVHSFVAKAVRKALQGKMYLDHGPFDSGFALAQGRPNDLGEVHPPLPMTPPPSSERVYQAVERFYETPKKFHELKVLGTIAATYILCESPENKLVLIDQHAAHERIGFERLKKNFVSKGKTSQRLLIPLTFEATPRQSAILNTHLGALKEAGLELEPFGGETFVVKACPVLLEEKKIPGLLEAVAQELEELETSGALKNTTEQVLKTIACHAQVRAKDKLSKEEIEHLLKEMDEYHATHCPHGRPTSVEISLSQIEKWFKRT